VGLIFQQFHLVPYLTAVENVMLAQYFHSMADRDEAAQALAQVGLRERSHHLPSELSGGEQQQLAIARGLMSRPTLLMLDEPSLGLAPQLVEEMFQLVAQLHKTGVTILLVEQNVERTLDIAGRVYLLNTGEVEFEGMAGELRERVDFESAYLGGSR